VIEILRFGLRPGADERAFVAADKTLQTDFAYHQPGLLRRTTARAADGGWVVIDLWRSERDADACEQRWRDDPVAARFMSFLDRTTVRTERFSELD